MSNFFNSLSGKKPSPTPGPKPSPPAAYQKGDVIDSKYEVRGELGKGGFGVVYLALDRGSQQLCALKTFKDEFIADALTREGFKKEVLLWVGLGQHPNIVSAKWVSEASGRLFVEMDYIAPDTRGCVTLTDHLKKAGRPLPVEQVVRWAAQFCAGMSHALAHGIECHRDIKPGNILITNDGTLKISDFGLAVAAEAALRSGSTARPSQFPGEVDGFSIWQSDGKGCCGTPGYMAPEVYRGNGAGVASDIYSFGLVLWQMTAGSFKLPFNVPYQGDIEAYMGAMYQQQMVCNIPQVHPKLDAIIQVLLEVDPDRRYKRTFNELRAVFEAMLSDSPILTSYNGRPEDTVDFWNTKGSSLNTLGRHEEALGCHDKALAIDPHCAVVWSNKGSALVRLGRNEEAIYCYDKALTIDPRFASAWSNKGFILAGLGRHREGISCYENALAITSQDARIWSNKGNSHDALGQSEEALRCYDKAVTIDSKYAEAYHNKGNALIKLGRYNEAISCYDKALAVDPLLSAAISNMGVALATLARHEDAINYFDRALAINPQFVLAWNGKALSEEALGRTAEAVRSYGQVLEFAPAQYARIIEYAQKRIRELNNR